MVKPFKTRSQFVWKLNGFVFVKRKQVTDYFDKIVMSLIILGYIFKTTEKIESHK
jgi:hypothetical protein